MVLFLAAGIWILHANAEQVTFAEVKPIFAQHCVRCHHKGGISRFSLETYAQARPWAKAIEEAVLSRKMPPWFVEKSSLRFDNDPSLSQPEIDKIRRWVREGATEGVVPTSNVAGTSDSIRADRVLRSVAKVRVPAKEEMPYQFLILPYQAKNDEWVQAVEVRPGNSSVVHHVVAYIREKESNWLRNAPVRKPFTDPNATKADILGVYAPGQAPSRFPKGMAKKIPAGADIILQIHYTPSGTAVDDVTSIAIEYAAQAPDKRVLTLQLNSTDIHIPANDADHRISASGTLPNDALLLSLFPHMHLRGKAFEYELIGEAGRVETLLRVSPYQFQWQLNYHLAEPRLLKKGTRLRCTAWYDNSGRNARNPNPNVDVEYGEQSWDEMMVGFFDVAVPAHMDKALFFVRQ